MKHLCTIFVLMAINFSMSHAENKTVTEKAKVTNENIGKTLTSVILTKSDSPVVISEKTLTELENLNAEKKAKEKQNITETTKPPQTNTAHIIVEEKPNNTSNTSAIEHDTGTVKSTESKETPNPLPSIIDKKSQTSTLTESSQSDSDQVEYQQVYKRIDLDIEGSVQTGFYILMGISLGALLFVCFKINKLRLTRAERKYGVQGNRSNQELAPLPLSMEHPDSDEEDQTLFDVNRQQIRIF